MQRAAGIDRPMTFHGLRHENASILLALSIPNTYAQERGGWAGPATLQRVYQHTLAGRQEEYDARMDTFMEGLFNVAKNVAIRSEKI